MRISDSILTEKQKARNNKEHGTVQRISHQQLND